MVDGLGCFLPAVLCGGGQRQLDRYRIPASPLLRRGVGYIYTASREALPRHIVWGETLGGGEGGGGRLLSATASL